MGREREARLCDVDAQELRRRGLSILFDVGDRQVWLPTSQVTVNPDGTITLPEWLAIKEGLV